MPAYLEVGRDLLSALWISLLYKSVCQRRNSKKKGCEAGRCECTRLHKHTACTQAEQCEGFSNTGLCQRENERPQSLKNWLNKTERERSHGGKFLCNRLYFVAVWTRFLSVQHREAPVTEGPDCDGEVMRNVQQPVQVFSANPAVTEQHSPTASPRYYTEVNWAG